MAKDLIAIKSDQHLSNFWYGKAGNSPNGEKADFIEGLDATDESKSLVSLLLTSQWSITSPKVSLALASARGP